MNLKSGAHIHLTGICGTAMASLAGLLKDQGFKVTGSDQNPYPPMSTQLEQLGIKIQTGYRAENLLPRPDLVIVGNVITAKNPEAIAIKELNLPATSLPKALGKFVIGDRESIVVAGTHGKTTTTSLMSWIADECGVKPGFMIGGIPKNYGFSFRNPQGNYFVIEGDEYDTAYFDKVPKFIHYKPRHVILTSIEFDHADIYADLAAVKDAFIMLLKLIPKNGHFIYLEKDMNIQSILSHCSCPNAFSYGIESGDFSAKILDASFIEGASSTPKIKFQVEFRGKKLGEFVTGLSGNYNVLNATSVVALGTLLNWPVSKIQSALLTFSGVKRRQEVLGEPGGVLVIEDFAHHPTAVRETLAGIKKQYLKRKIWAVFEPRSATSRRKIFQEEYVKAFRDANHCLIAKAYDQSKIDEKDRFSTEELVRDLNMAHNTSLVLSHNFPFAKVCENVQEIVADLQKNAQSGDLVLIMSNGGFDGIYGKLIAALEHKDR